MAIKSEIDGVKEIKEAFKEAAGNITQDVFVGMIKGALLIQREAQLLTPVDLGNLRASGYTVFSKNAAIPPVSSRGRFKSDGSKGNTSRLQSGHTAVISRGRGEVKARKDGITGALINPKAIVGFSAFYAQVVHEDLDVEHTVGQAKYLEKSINNNASKVAGFIRAAAKL